MNSSEQNNLSLNRYVMSDIEELRLALYKYLCPLIMLLGVIAIIINALVLVAYSRIERRRMTSSLRLNLSLVISDILTSFWIAVSLLINAYLPIVHGIDPTAYNACVPLTMEIFRMSGFFTCILHLMAMAVNHLLSIVRAFDYKRIFSQRNTIILISLLWAVPLLGMFMFSMSIPNGAYLSPNGTCLNLAQFHALPYRLTVSMLLLIFIFTICICYFNGWIKIRRMAAKFSHSKIDEKERLTTNTTPTIVNYNERGSVIAITLTSAKNANQVNRSRKILLTSVLICGTFCIGWLPAAIQFAFPGDGNPNPSYNELVIRFVMGFISLACIMLKSIVNPVIYAVRIPEIKCQIKRFRYGDAATRCEMTTHYPNPMAVDKSQCRSAYAQAQDNV